MGLLVDGVWRDDSFDKARLEGGRFVRPTTKFRNWITPDGSPGPSGEGGFAAEAGRYHLYVSLACPWAHRTLIFRKLKQLESVISMSVVVLATWASTAGPSARTTGSSGDTVNGTQQARRKSICSPTRTTPAASRVPVLWDKKRSTIVNNESSEIIRMLNSAFDAFTNERTDYYPPELRERDRRDQRPRLSERQQRRLSRRLRHHAGRLRGGVPRRVRDARRDRAAAVAAALSRRRRA